MEFNTKQLSESKFWRQNINEFLGTMFWVMLSMNETAAGNPYALGITYIVVKHAMSCFDSEGLHMFTPWTLFKMLENKHLDPIKGLFWIGMQFLGAYVGGVLAGALGIKLVADTGIANSFTGADNVAMGFRYFFAVSFLIQIFSHCSNNADSSDIPVSLMMVFGFAISTWFMGGFYNLSFSTGFAYAHTENKLNANLWIEFVWTLIAVVVAWVKFTFVLPAMNKE